MIDFLSPIFGIEIASPRKVATMLNTDFIVKEEKNPIVIYHNNCADGFSAAWCFHNAQDKWETTFDFHGGSYGEDPFAILDLTDRDVYLVDFSYKRDIVERMIVQGCYVTLIDHHKTAIEDLRCFYDREHQGWEYRFAGKFCAFVDLERSGAMLAWDFCHNTTAVDPTDPNWAYRVNTPWNTKDKTHPAFVRPPLLLEHVQDRDLWRFKLEGTRPIQAALFSYDYTFENWDKLMKVKDRGAQVVERTYLYEQGSAIERKHFKDIRELIKVAVRWMLIGRIDMPVLNCPYMWGSDAGHIMATELNFPDSGLCTQVAAYYYDTAEHRVFGLRSTENGPDVSEIAKIYGGGGHKHAAGFKVPRHHFLARE